MTEIQIRINVQMGPLQNLGRNSERPRDPSKPKKYWKNLADQIVREVCPEWISKYPVNHASGIPERYVWLLDTSKKTYALHKKPKAVNFIYAISRELGMARDPKWYVVTQRLKGNTL